MSITCNLSGKYGKLKLDLTHAELKTMYLLIILLHKEYSNLRTRMHRKTVIVFLV